MEQNWPDWLEYELNLHELESKNEKAVFGTFSPDACRDFLAYQGKKCYYLNSFDPADRSLFGSAFEVFLASGDVGVPQKSWEFHQWNVHMLRI